MSRLVRLPATFLYIGFPLFLLACSPTTGKLPPGGVGGGGGDAGGDSNSDGSTPGTTGDDGGSTSGPQDDAGVTTPPCQLDCQKLGASCGIQSDGCGGQLDCGSCSGGDTCGGGGVPNQCGHGTTGGPGGPCVPTTCAALGLDCGPAGDGCGGTLDCWNGATSCPNPSDICGGGGKPGVCGNSVSSGGCTGPLCPATCPTGQTTTIEGYVYAPTPPAWGAPDPLPNALVYIPSTALDPLPSGPSCSCTPASGNPVAYTTSDDKGHFVLSGTPAGAAGTIPLVVQLGKWRREVKLSVAVTACTNNLLTNTDDTRLPRKAGDGLVADLPKLALVTGAYDEIECTLLKMGIDQSEFTNPGGSGHVSIYENGGNYLDTNTPENSPYDAWLSGDTAKYTPLTGSAAALKAYDGVILDCIGGEEPEAQTLGQDKLLADYVNQNGGRVFTSHYGYSWLQKQYASVATWSGAGLAFKDGVTATIEGSGTAGTPGFSLATWLYAAAKGAYAFGTITVDQVKESVSAVVTSAVRYYLTYQFNATTRRPLQLTWDTPTSAPCGRVVFADFHVDLPAGSSTAKQLFPTKGNGPCASTPNPMTVQEKVLEYALFDLTSCVNAPPPPPPPTCTPIDCAAQNIGCGPAGNGCGGTLDCGPCTQPGETCGGGGTPYQCGKTVTCQPLTCQDLGYDCGPAGDGCGGVLDCGQCPAGQTCGGLGQPGICGGLS